MSPLRGYADQRVIGEEGGRRSRTSKRDRDSGLAESTPTRGTSTTGQYNAQFEQIMIDNGVYPDGYRKDGDRPPKPQNLDEIRRRLSQVRLSLSPSAFSEGAFEDFQDNNRRATSEIDIRTNVMPAIFGRQDNRHHAASAIVFNNLEPFHPGLTVPALDRYYGAVPEQIDPPVRDDLSQFIEPSNDKTRPAAPNFFVEAKGPSGRGDLLQRQAMYAGAVGARGMHRLQNYGKESPVYDCNAYSTTATYNASAGTLQMYATHPQKSATGQPKYYMTPLRSYAMTDTSDSFRQGAAAYRNARDMSKEMRDRFITDANATARSIPAVATPSSVSGSLTNISPVGAGGSFESVTSTNEMSAESGRSSRR